MPSTTTTSVRAGVDAVMTVIRDETARRDPRVPARLAELLDEVDRRLAA